MTSARIWSMVLIFASLLLGILVVHVLTAPPPPIPNLTQAMSGTAKQIKKEKYERLPPRALAEFSAITERPVFFASRRPAPPSVDSKDPQRTLNGIVLMGTVIGQGRKAALVHVPNSPSQRTILEGEEVAGWRLEQVLPNRIVLSLGENIVEISIWENHPKLPKADLSKRRDKKRGQKPKETPKK